jgi:hypothetical protein
MAMNRPLLLMLSRRPGAYFTTLFTTRFATRSGDYFLFRHSHSGTGCGSAHAFPPSRNPRRILSAPAVVDQRVIDVRAIQQEHITMVLWYLSMPQVCTHLTKLPIHN